MLFKEFQNPVGFSEKETLPNVVRGCLPCRVDVYILRCEQQVRSQVPKPLPRLAGTSIFCQSGHCLQAFDPILCLTSESPHSSPSGSPSCPTFTTFPSWEVRLSSLGQNGIQRAHGYDLVKVVGSGRDLELELHLRVPCSRPGTPWGSEYAFTWAEWAVEAQLGRRRSPSARLVPRGTAVNQVMLASHKDAEDPGQCREEAEVAAEGEVGGAEGSPGYSSDHVRESEDNA